MQTTSCQRWRAQRSSYRPAGEPIQPKHYEVAEIEDDSTARAFVCAHHYAGSYVSARFRVGLYRGASLVGVAVLSHPSSEQALRVALPFPAMKRAELGRFVLLDDVPSNGETWFLRRAFELAARDGFEAIVSHSDPHPRVDAQGALVFPGHIGTIYQAHNAVFVGRANRATWRMFADGSVFSARRWSKLRQREKGWQAAVELLRQHGAPAPRGPWAAWVWKAVHMTTSPMRHPGVYRYLFGLDRTAKRVLPRGLRYPKFDPSPSEPR